jgi:hypothetical protein
MARRTILSDARDWEPADGDTAGGDKRALLDFLLEHGRGVENAVAIARIKEHAHFSRLYSREAIQQQLIVPLRDEGRVFIGTCNRGIFLLEKAEDAEETINFYSTRIRSELRHVRSVKALARRYKLFKKYKSAKPPIGETLIYFDESGTPSLTDAANEPFFIIAAVLVEDRRILKTLPKRFEFIAESLGKPKNYEFRFNRLNKKQRAKVLRELGVVDFQWAAVCFVKARLTSPGFAQAKNFYKYASQFLAGDLLTISSRTELYFDEYGASQSRFDKELQSYLVERNAGLPPEHLKSITMLASGKERLIQLADLIAGVARRAAKGDPDLLYSIEDKMIDMRVWPPK